MNEPEDTRFSLIGNKPALDFANTVHARRQDVDALQSACDFFDLLEHLALVPADTLARYRKVAAVDTAGAGDLLKQALAFRREIRKWLEAGLELPSPSHALLKMVNRLLAANASYEALQRKGTQWSIESVPLEETLLLSLAPIARSVAELIAEGPQAPVRKCGNPRCPLYFYDISRNQKRRWCSMESCGNQAKVRSFLKRHSHVHAAE